MQFLDVTRGLTKIRPEKPAFIMTWEFQKGLFLKVEFENNLRTK